MPKFRKKPVVIDAIHFYGLNSDGVPVFETEPSEWLLSAMADRVVMENRDGHLNIKTLEGTMKADPHDWIIRGVKGELYPCKPDIFELTYQRVEPAAEVYDARVQRAWLAAVREADGETVALPWVRAAIEAYEASS